MTIHPRTAAQQVRHAEQLLRLAVAALDAAAEACYQEAVPLLHAPGQATLVADLTLIRLHCHGARSDAVVLRQQMDQVLAALAATHPARTHRHRREVA